MSSNKYACVICNITHVEQHPIGDAATYPIVAVLREAMLGARHRHVLADPFLHGGFVWGVKGGVV